MESKIEKIGYFLVPSGTSEGVTDALQSLADKLNEIIDYLNSQAQPEERRTATGSQMEAETEINKRKNLLIDVVRELEKAINGIAFEHKGEKIFVGELLRDLGYDNFYNFLPKRLQIITSEDFGLIPQDTTEELTDKKKGVDRGVDKDNTEKWGKDFDGWFGMELTTELSNSIKNYIVELLDEREREVRKQERMIRLHKRVSKKIDNLEEPYKSFAKAGAGII